VGDEDHRPLDRLQQAGPPVVQSFDSPLDEPVVYAVQRIAEARQVTMAQIALAWVLTNPIVSAPIVGATKPITYPRPSQPSV